ncbi:hypothetical protein [Acetobacter pomorum]|uniref:hypothetical protein n=1 Tax=Acetobacter pomorum TaxID=65959 RepID=UPI00142DE05A|nr:hypothetical protein [Acetobacter pomorum]
MGPGSKLGGAAGPHPRHAPRRSLHNRPQKAKPNHPAPLRRQPITPLPLRIFCTAACFVYPALRPTRRFYTQAPCLGRHIRHAPRKKHAPRPQHASMGAMPKARPRRIAAHAWICQIHALCASLLLRGTPHPTATPQASLGAAIGYGVHTSAMLERRWTAPHPCLCIFCNKGAPSARFFF